MKCFLLFISLLSMPSLVMAKAAYECSEATDCKVAQDKNGKNGVEVCKQGDVVRRKITYKNNQMNGLWECFDDKGVLKESREYKNDKQNGLTKRWSTDVKKFEESRFLDDELDGKSVTYQSSFSGGKYELTGRVETEYKKNNQHGFQVFFDKDGKETRRICFQDDNMKKDNPELCGGKAEVKEEAKANPTSDSPDKGWKTTYFKSKNIKAKFLLVGYGEYEEYESFYENGKRNNYYKRKTRGDLKTPDIYTYISMDSKGKTLAEGECLVYPTQDFYGDYCSYLNGKGYDYDDNDKLTRKASYKNGKLDGEVISYDLKEGTETTFNYAKGVKMAMVQKKTSDGSVLKREEYYPDGSVK